MSPQVHHRFEVNPDVVLKGATIFFDPELRKTQLKELGRDPCSLEKTKNRTTQPHVGFVEFVCYWKGLPVIRISDEGKYPVMFALGFRLLGEKGEPICILKECTEAESNATPVVLYRNVRKKQTRPSGTCAK